MKFLEHQLAKQSALWIKENAKALNVLAGVFFVFTFLAGIAWALGREIEPVAFVLSLCASSLFGLPHLAEFILPTRKPVKNMTHDELLEFVKLSNPVEDWRGTGTDWVSEIFLREDPRLRFRVNYTEDGIQRENFHAEWANNHPDPHATGYWCDLFYDGNMIERFVLVSIDGARAKLPPPHPQSKNIELLQYRVAQIHDSLGTLDEYITRSGLTVSENT